jgi:hypothetical protein
MESSEYLTDAKFRGRFNAMRLAREMTDVVLVVEGTEFPAHKIILSGCSSYFRGMFREGSNFYERQRDRVEIDPKGELGIRADAVGQLVGYVYTGRVDISHHNVIDLIRAADLLELAEIKNKTLSVIEKHINFDTYLDIRDVGNVFDCPRLSDAVDRFIRKNFALFSKTDTFLALEEQEVLRYLRHECLRTETEEDVFDAAMTWCKSRGDMEAFVRLGVCIRFNLLSVKFLAGVLKDDVEVRAHDEVSKFILEEMRSPSTAVVINSRPRLSTRVLVAMPYTQSNFYLMMFYGDHVEFEARAFPEYIAGSHTDFCVCRIDNTRLFVAGGIHYGEGDNLIAHTHKCYVYDLTADEWSLSPVLLLGDLDNFGMASLNGRIYVVGGTGIPALNGGATAFSIDPEVPGAEWSETAMLNVTRNSVSLAVANQRIYAIGGKQIDDVMPTEKSDQILIFLL